VWKNWAFGIVEGLTIKSGALDDSPLQAFLEKLGTPLLPVKRPYVITAVDVNSGNYVRFTEENTTDVHKMAREALSSSSMPLIFPTQTWKEYGITLMDGGSDYNVNLVDAVNRCRNIADKDEEITIDILSCDPLELAEYKDGENSLNNFLRKREIKTYWNNYADIWKEMQGFPKVNFRYVVMPSHKLYGGLDLINFDNATHTWEAQ